MPKKPNNLTLEEIWDLEDKHTAFVGCPSGAKASPQTGVESGVVRRRKAARTSRVAEEPPKH